MRDSWWAMIPRPFIWRRLCTRLQFACLEAGNSADSCPIVTTTREDWSGRFRSSIGPNASTATGIASMPRPAGPTHVSKKSLSTTFGMQLHPPFSRQRGFLIHPTGTAAAALWRPIDMRVTVITPSLNQGAFIGDCLRSVHEQTHRDIEHLVIDGMSTDRTAEIAAAFPCRFLRSRDSGPAQAINRGLELATGEIVCWLNTDDAFWSTRTLERVVHLFEEQPQVDVITGNGYYMDENGVLAVPIAEPPNRYCLPWLRRVDSLLQPATFWRR